jgi:3-hydroxyacyl-CoA dehydrogenase
LADKLGMGAAVWDIGDGVLCFEFTSKMNSLDFFTMKTLNKALDMIEAGKYKALVVHNEGADFSLGANLGLAQYAAKAKQFWVIDKMVQAGQETYKRIKYFKHPVVSAPSGKALGGGCEILLHSHHVQAHAELYPGLVEIGVGLLPAWGGCAEILTRAKQSKKLPKGPIPAAAKAFEIISMAQVAMSAQEAKDLMYLRETDGITMNKSRLLFDAKKKALEMAKDFKPEVPFDMQLPGPAGHAAFSMAVEGNYMRGIITPYDVIVSDKVAKVLTGGDCADTGVVMTQDYIRQLEREHFMELARDPRTLNRIVTTLKGKGRKEYEPQEQKARGPQKAAQLRDEGTKVGFFARVFKGKSAQKPFGKVCGKSANDNKSLTKDTKAQVNWPKKG